MNDEWRMTIFFLHFLLKMNDEWRMTNDANDDFLFYIRVIRHSSFIFKKKIYIFSTRPFVPESKGIPEYCESYSYGFS